MIEFWNDITLLLPACFLALGAHHVLCMSKRGARILLFVMLIVSLWSPVHHLLSWGILIGLNYQASIPTLILTLIGIHHLLCAEGLTVSHEITQATYILLSITGVLLYGCLFIPLPSIWWGASPWLLAYLLYGLSLVSILCRWRLLTLVLWLTLLAMHAQCLTTTDAWCYWQDPLITLYAWGWCMYRLIDMHRRQRTYARLLRQGNDAI